MEGIESARREAVRKCKKWSGEEVQEVGRSRERKSFPTPPLPPKQEAMQKAIRMAIPSSHGFQPMAKMTDEARSILFDAFLFHSNLFYYILLYQVLVHSTIL